ncbi:DUF6923 family protein, partial [Bacillus mobilis]|uniref:DUF6923 family protein n=1 Tax=Bacillus mobilis TaxID=2026190 RepID=UPI002FD81852
MASIIQGTVFNDLNQNGTFDPGEPGIPNVFVVLQDPNGTCTSTQTDGLGNYSFPGLTVSGAYTIYETVANPGATCPPTTFTQPTGFTTSSTPRVTTLTITQTDINNNVVFSNQNFGHENVISWPCGAAGLQVAGSPAHMFEIDLVTGTSTDLGLVTPAADYNAIGYSVVDNSIYGANDSSPSIVRINPDLTVTTFGPITGLPNLGFNVGDVDLNGHLYVYTQDNSRFYVIDVNPNSATFLKLVDPTAGFVEQTSNFGTAITPRFITDWAFNPVDGQLYSILNFVAGNSVIRINPLTGAETILITTGVPSAQYGAMFFDAQGFLYAINNATGEVIRITLSALNATGVHFSTSASSSNNDGARCPLALLNLLSIVKSVDKTIASLGDILTYTVVINNVGIVEDATNVVFNDPIPSGTTFVPGSVTVNGIPTAGNPSVGIPLGTIPAGGTVTVTFQVQIGTSTPPPSNPILNTASVQGDNTAQTFSNEVSTQINYAVLSSTKSVDKAIANVGDTLTYTVTLTNTGNVSADNVLFTDPIPNGTTFVANSFTINGVPQPGANPGAGVNIGSIAAGASVTVTFQVTVSAIPNPNPIVNTATTTFQYTVDPNQPPVDGTSTSNPVTTQVNNATLSSTKSVDKAIANVGDTLTYTVTLTNTGNVSADNVLFTDPIPNGTTFVANSFTINGVPQPGANPGAGVNIGSIAAGASVTVTFQVTVSAIPNPNPIVNTATTTFQYTVNPNQPPVDGTSTSNPVTTQVNIAVLSSTKSVDKAIANVGDTLTYTVTLTNTSNVSAD